MAKIEFKFAHQLQSDTGGTLLTVTMEDEKGSEYNWVPKWGDVSLLFRKAIMTEIDNTLFYIQSTGNPANYKELIKFKAVAGSCLDILKNTVKE